MKKEQTVKTEKGKSETDIRKLIVEHRERLWQLRLDLAAGKVKNVREIQTVRREIARLETSLNQK